MAFPVREKRGEPPGWLRFASIGCGLLALVLFVILLAGVFRRGSLLVVGIEAMERRVLSRLPADVGEEDRSAMRRSFECVAAAVRDGRLSEEDIRPLGAQSAGRAPLTPEQAGGIATLARDLCARAAERR